MPPTAKDYRSAQAAQHMHFPETLVQHRYVPGQLCTRTAMAIICPPPSLARSGSAQRSRSSFGKQHRIADVATSPDSCMAGTRGNLKNATSNVRASSMQPLLPTLPGIICLPARSTAPPTEVRHHGHDLPANAADSAIRATQVVHCKADFGRLIPSSVDLVNNVVPNKDPRANACRQAGIRPRCHSQAAAAL